MTEFDTVPPHPEKTHWNSSQFRKRVISAVVLAPPVLLAAAFGGLPFYTLIILVAIFMMREWDVPPARLVWAGKCTTGSIGLGG